MAVTVIFVLLSWKFAVQGDFIALTGSLSALPLDFVLVLAMTLKVMAACCCCPLLLPLALPQSCAFQCCLDSLLFLITCDSVGMVSRLTTRICAVSKQLAVYSFVHHLPCRSMESPLPCGSTSSMARSVCSCSLSHASRPSLQCVTLWWTLSITMSSPICESSHLTSVRLVILDMTEV